MKHDNITLAPSTAQVSTLYKAWQENHIGTLDDFYVFFTTPSLAREEFLFLCESKSDLKGVFITREIL